VHLEAIAMDELRRLIANDRTQSSQVARRDDAGSNHPAREFQTVDYVAGRTSRARIPESRQLVGKRDRLRASSNGAHSLQERSIFARDQIQFPRRPRYPNFRDYVEQNALCSAEMSAWI